MADMPAVATRRLTRDKLATFLPNHEAIKAFEALQQDVGTTLPEAIAAAPDDADDVAANAVALAQVAQALAQQAVALAAMADDLVARVAALEAQLAPLAARVADLEGGPP